jgi:hypothetical protein|tara:strand:+ start:2916 stop:4799 length:1884 start_codon:yes stop_codon:yes gene_type:complete
MKLLKVLLCITLLAVSFVLLAAEPSTPAERRAFFGELHLHTAMSFDAWTFGTKVMPDQAYKFARGETVMVPGVQVFGYGGIEADKPVPAQRAWPLDFAAVTDHAEYLGAMSELDDADSPFSKSGLGQKLRDAGQSAFFMSSALRRDPEGIKLMSKATTESGGWNVEIKAANDNYEPGKFTTFIAYEWTASAGNGIHLHRNVIFNGDHAPAPFTAVDSNDPEKLWQYLNSVRTTGMDVLAIPHNSNLSDGHDFDWNKSDGRPIDEVYALERALNEPLVEIAQTKGTSETTPELSPGDEFANFEIMDRIYVGETTPTQHGSYVREAFGRGLVIQSSSVGVNPFKMGVVGGSDLHNALSVSDENSYANSELEELDPNTAVPIAVTVSRIGTSKPEELERRPSGQVENDPLQMASGAITGVWAEQNTREAIFAALKRKETFATSGTRIRLRMFAGWEFPSNMTSNNDWVKQVYAHGVAMGSDLPSMPASAKAPTLVLQAQKDPDGANLDRIQVIKVWLEGDDYREKVFEAALSGDRAASGETPVAPVGNTVDLITGKYTNTIGATSLLAVWRDPEFDPAKPAVYYARALEIPTPRWTTFLAIRNHLPIPTHIPATIQERAWSSPVWFTPAK